MNLAALPTIKILIAVICAATSLKATTPVFSPPKEWKTASSPSSKVAASFILKTKNNFSPSLNFTIENFSCSTEDYLSSLEKLYITHSDNRFRRLGTLSTKSGKAHLTSLDMTVPAGKVRILQSILFQDQKAYILTGAVPLEGFISYQEELIETFCSISFVEQLEEYIQEKQKKELFIQKASLISSKKDLSSFMKFLRKEFSKEGLHWQSLVIQELSKKIDENSTGK